MGIRFQVRYQVLIDFFYQMWRCMYFAIWVHLILVDISVAGLSSLSDVSCYYLDLNNGLRVVGLSEMNNVSINEHANIKDVSCD